MKLNDSKIREKLEREWRPARLPIPRKTILALQTIYLPAVCIQTIHTLIFSIQIVSIQTIYYQTFSKLTFNTQTINVQTFALSIIS